MKRTDAPLKITIPFAANGQMNTIPQQSTTDTIANGIATMPTGFPQKTMTPIPSGGFPPQGEDLNGILNLVTTKQQFSDAGARYPFDASFAAATSGYPSGATTISTDLTGVWLNTVDGNSTDPESSSVGSTGWVPFGFTGVSTVAISTSNVAMRPLVAAKPTIVLSGSLTANRYLFVPSWAKEWTFVNNCTGSFAVIIAVQNGGSTVSIPASTSSRVLCDGYNCFNITGFKFANDSQQSANGCTFLPSGILIQWGTVDYDSYPNEIQVDVTFPQPFPNNCFTAHATRKMSQHSSNGDGGANLIGTPTKTMASFSLQQYEGNYWYDLRGFTWFAIGN
ncbi:gp53-like domain-containing protein [Acinetobacter nectaris]|uniref:gp53-like domain-containing protein n=1 Tax=Acinetobacter nectaris TaxID=1219382 RepID=UPI001F1B4185|nr:hypothetical protein [Acinetobacter nectaris]MCF9034184.1 hypothetical protein [Acinetobacter nectaris]